MTSTRIGRILVGLVGLLGAACGDTATPATTPATTAIPAPVTTGVPSGAPTAGRGIDSDEPCTAHVIAGSSLMPTPFRLDDLPRMVLTKDDVGGLDDFEVDPWAWGFTDNDWLDYVDAQPPGTCDTLATYGRINGYSTAYVAFDESSARMVRFAVHLFWDEPSAGAWSRSYLEAMGKAPAGATGPRSVSTVAEPRLGEGGQVMTVESEEGTRTWAIFQRGPVVGWVIDLHQDPATTIDVVGAAYSMAGKTDRVIASAMARPRAGLDAAQAMSVPLRLESYGPAYSGLVWDEVYGGCMDIDEAVITFGDSGGDLSNRPSFQCTAMFSSKDQVGSDDTVVRVFSRLIAYDETDAAGRGFAEAIERLGEQDFSTAFDIGDLGDERIAMFGVSAEAEGQRNYRAVVRLGQYIVLVQISDMAATDHGPELELLAQQLVDRLDQRLAEG